jgi:hypothetical protein
MKGAHTMNNLYLYNGDIVENSQKHGVVYGIVEAETRQKAREKITALYLEKGIEEIDNLQIHSSDGEYDFMYYESNER